MKVLGRAIEGLDNKFKYIVELNMGEYAQLIKLSLALKGAYSDNDWYRLTESISEVDLFSALEVINAFSNVKNNIEKLKIKLQELDDKLMAKDVS